jgi:hypothetical protein
MRSLLLDPEDRHIAFKNHAMTSENGFWNF